MAWMIQYGQKRKSYIDTFLIHPLTWIFKQFWWPKWFWKKITKKLVSWNNPYLKYGLRFVSKFFFLLLIWVVFARGLGTTVFILLKNLLTKHSNFQNIFRIVKTTFLNWCGFKYSLRCSMLGILLFSLISSQDSSSFISQVFADTVFRISLLLLLFLIHLHCFVWFPSTFVR